MATRPTTRRTQASAKAKLGLALSGGGLRASFFHIGVLAQLARQGLLRHVEAISAVSGGSIIAALYYLHLKNLLESKPDEAVTDEDYVAIIQTIERDFLKATENNLRMKTFASFAHNWKMRHPDYSRSDRIAELYDELIYRAAFGREAEPIPMQVLKIFPPGRTDFYPRTDNVGRSAKVPVLILNATTLNTGRNWQFTAQTMGEPDLRTRAAAHADDTDTKPLRLRRADSYAGLVPYQADFPLGHAVGASACVPGLFHPLAISGLYRDGEEDIRVQLVDGGVHDNQGVQALLFEECTAFVVSDASGWLALENQPGVDPASVLLRASGILQDRVRDGNLSRLIETQGRGQIAFLHLRKGLEIRELAWLNTEGQPAEDTGLIGPDTRKFGVDPAVQQALANIRTDLDAFTEVEAYSLMLDGYLMSELELTAFKKTVHAPELRAAPTAAPIDWQFLRVQPWIDKPGEGDYLRQLRTGHLLFGKALLLFPALLAGLIVSVLIALVLAWPTLVSWVGSSIPVSLIVSAVALYALDALGGKLVKLPKLGQWADLLDTLKFLRTALAYYQSAKRLLLRVAVPLAGTLLAQFYLAFINPRFLKRGRIETLQKGDPR
ncbi:patatin-like phospholipase family protein [Methylococcus sp. EFPC2]|uniref:patatin-like phospholipase family protein n=1 Tax=Methylococcus sp. EFPC2 TaxID=2812648 RepID=UPI001966F501|nr:patatin-like phospholipase family protein [Methylococcus sp. EFPC2]QSA97882.1 patatin-like phospholipase family protein [Methylococcus sp. EFPC2]